MLLARVGFCAAERGHGGDERLRRGVDGADDARRSSSPGCSTSLSLPFVAALYAADAVGNVVAHRAEFQADRRVVRMGYGRNLSQALRRVISLGGGQRPVGWRARLAASHPPARTRVARIDAMLRHPAR